ncbi:LANO_0F12486g1_1 [Lachancea nothofagi CBS 11611]|uniref:AP-1 complex subunit gamma n=1 Tax=Lachancea nothofagi CBS 11611 TaxID=1266666 RepID=A0A1G4KBD9_9SACH|nr:LANO_0F12486g1_1 [Lachancea nothofagi CBS 11611]
MGSLRTFIKDVRGAKTLAEERSIVTKESARIRTKLKDDHLPQDKRRKNIHKLLYLHILGEKTHFAQVECINLIASDDFRDKRIGYLAAVILLDENQEILTLLTNLLNSDLNHPNRYVVSLALSALGSLTSPELARDLYTDVESILARSTDEFLVKKALQCAAKIVQRDAALLEIFYPYIESILKSHHLSSHGVRLGVAKLCQAAILSRSQYEYDNYPEILQSLVLNIPEFYSLLQDMNATNFNPEYNVNGTCDPFLQVELLYTLRLLFELAPQETERYKDKLNDLLTQIATNSDGTKNSAHAVLYECVRTIFALQLEQSLKVLGVNVLAKFLSGKDNNTKYVALNTLLLVVPQEPHAVQKHRKFVSRCLFDPDVSIRTRAVELTFAILDSSNMKELIGELSSFLKASGEQDKDLIVFVVDHLIELFELHAVGHDNWAIDVMVDLLKVVGQHIALEKVSEIMMMINNLRDLDHKSKLIKQVLQISLGKSDGGVSGDNLGWKLVSVWCIGEYGDILLQNSYFLDTELTGYLTLLNGLYSHNVKIISYILTAALKLSAKIQNPACNEDLRQIIKGHMKDTNLILQAKSSQYSIIFNQPAKQKQDVLGAMPFFERKNKNGNSKSDSKPDTKIQEPNLLLDLLESTPASNGQTKNDSQTLASIFGDQPSNNTANVATEETSHVTIPIPSDAVHAYNSSDMDVSIKVDSVAPSEAKLDLYVKAHAPIKNLQVLAAVSKTQKLVMGTLSNHSIAAGQVSRQELKVTGSGKLKFRIKLVHESPTGTQIEQFDHKLDQSL